MIASAVSGGLNVIFNALEQTGVYHAAIYKTLESLPITLNRYDNLIDIVSEDVELHRKTAKLYTAVCMVLNHVLRWIVANAFGKHIRYCLALFVIGDVTDLIDVDIQQLSVPKDS